MRIIVSVSGRSLADYANRLEKIAGGSGRASLAQALNQAGHEVRQKTVAAETGQTGLKGDVIDRAQQEIDASASSLAYTITSRGGNVRMKFFGAREGGGGVTAHPWNSTTFVKGGFIKAGWGARVDLPWGGEVKQRVGRGRLPLKTVRSGLFIPTEMVQGKTAGAFNAGAAEVASAIISRLGVMLP